MNILKKAFSVAILLNASLSFAKSEPVNSKDDDKSYLLYAVPYLAEVGVLVADEYIIKQFAILISSHSAHLGLVLPKLFNTIAEVGVRAVSEPAKDRTQSLFQQFFQASVQNDDPRAQSVEKKLAERMAEIEGRLGVEAQMSRAVFERMYPIIEDAFSAAQAAITDKKNVEEAARLLVYAALFTANLYPEMDSNDATIQRLARTYFSQGVNKSLKDAILQDVEDSGDSSALALLVEWGLVEATLPNLQSSKFLKDFVLGSVSAAGYLIPALASTFLIPKLARKPIFKDFPLMTNVIVSFLSNQIYYGITAPHSLMISSETQKWMISHSINRRVDEEENSDRAHKLFVEQNRRVRTLISPQAQALRTHLILMLRVLISHFKEAREKIWLEDSKAAVEELVAAAMYLRTHFPEIASDDPFVCNAVQTFFSKWVTMDTNAAIELANSLNHQDPEGSKDPKVLSYYRELFNQWGFAF